MFDSLSRLLRAAALAALAVALFQPAARADNGGNVSVRVDIQDETVRINAETVIAATPREVWEVLTDWENLPKFISNIAASKVISRSDQVVRVAQTGKAGFGPFTFEFQSTREMKLSPYERFESRMVAGNMKQFRGLTSLDAVEAGTRIRYQSEAVPDTVLPLGLARSTIEAETREHYLEVGREVLRRKAAVGRQ